MTRIVLGELTCQAVLNNKTGQAIKVVFLHSIPGFFKLAKEHIASHTKLDIYAPTKTFHESLSSAGESLTASLTTTVFLEEWECWNGQVQLTIGTWCCWDCGFMSGNDAFITKWAVDLIEVIESSTFPQIKVHRETVSSQRCSSHIISPSVKCHCEFRAVIAYDDFLFLLTVFNL